MIEICAIIRNENEYLYEWCKYHLDLGFDRIVLYDNGSEKNLYTDIELWSKFTPEDQAKVIVRLWTNDHAQIQCYTAHAKTLTTADWVAFIDADEFITFKTYKTIQDFLAQFDDSVSAVCLHWICYGANGHWTKPNERIVDAYTKPCPDPVSSHYKTIARPMRVNQFTSPHDCTVNTGRIVNEANSHVRGDLPSLETAWINHYFTKSYEEWLQKIERGRADTNQKRTVEEFFSYNPDMKQ